MINKSHSSIFVLVLLLIGMVASVSHVQKVEGVFSPTLTINSDGRITPSTTLMTTTDNITYTLTDNITADFNVINVGRDDIILDGAGYTLQSVQRYSGISLGFRNNVTLRNFKITNCGDGIHLDADTWITISNCTITENYRGIFNGYSGGPKNFTFINNTVAGRDECVDLGTVYDGLISGNKILQAIDHRIVYGLVLQGGENVTVRDNVISGVQWGIWPLGNCNDTSIFGNTIRDNGCGINLYGNKMTLKIYHNYFINNNEHARAEIAGANCTWDDGYPSGGNYWSGYVSPDSFNGEYQSITGGDGIGDNPFVINWPNNDKDRYPFMMISICNVSQAPSRDNVLSTDTVRVNATITHVNPLEQVVLNCTYINSSATWMSSINMTNLEDDIWNGVIQSFPVGTNVTYAIIAQDNAGNSINSKDQEYTFDYPVLIPEFPTYTLLSMLFVATLFAALVLRRKRIA